MPEEQVHQESEGLSTPRGLGDTPKAPHQIEADMDGGRTQENILEHEDVPDRAKPRYDELPVDILVTQCSSQPKPTKPHRS